MSKYGNARIVFLLFVTLFLVSPLELNAESLADSKKIYCPSKIFCSRDDDLSSCVHTDESSPYWDGVIYATYDIPNTPAGEYFFDHNAAPYHTVGTHNWSVTANVAICTYTNGWKELELRAKPESNLEASSAWSVDGHQRVRCESNTAKNCPLKEAHSVAFYVPDSSLHFTVHGAVILPQGNFPENYMMVRYEDALPYCYKESLCKLDMHMDGEGLIGQVEVDTNNAMRIVKIITVSPAFSMTQNVPFNSIKIEKLQESASPYLTIKNKLPIELSMSFDGSPISTIHGTYDGAKASEVIVSFKKLLSICNGFIECTIDIGTNYSNKGDIGSVTVDMQNEMKVLRVISYNPSEIVVRQIDASNVINIYYSDELKKIRRTE